MFQGKKIGVVVPAYNEEKLITRVLDTMPHFVDGVVIVDDGSRDNTRQVVENRIGQYPFQLHVAMHERNRGVGTATATGYKLALEKEWDIIVVMNGDAQMDPHDLEHLIVPIAEGVADYAKGNRLFTGDAWKIIPKIRYIGNAVLSLLTKIVSGYWHVSDSQTGYTAINRKTLSLIDLGTLYPRYGVPNDMLVKLNVLGARVIDVPIKPIYNIGEKSNIRIPIVVFTISFLLIRLFFWRLKEKYVIRDFHPLVFFYIFGLLFLLAGIALGIMETVTKITTGVVPVASVVLVALLVISGFQFLFFAMWFDMQSNYHLK